MVCSKNCKISSSECPRKQGDTNRSDFSFATLRKHGEKGVSLLLLNRYFSIEFRQNFYMCICRKGETFTLSIFENIGRQLYKLLPKYCANRSDLSARPVVFPPVMTTVLPSSLALLLHTPPAKWGLSNQSPTTESNQCRIIGTYSCIHVSLMHVSSVLLFMKSDVHR